MNIIKTGKQKRATYTGRCWNCSSEVMYYEEEVKRIVNWNGDQIGTESKDKCPVCDKLVIKLNFKSLEDIE